MSKKNNMLPINPDKLRLRLLEKGLQNTTVSIDMGFCHNYISDVLRRKMMGVPCSVLLAEKYGIRYSEYKAEAESEPEPEPEIPEVPATTELTVPPEFWTALYNHIYRATYEAVKKAWEDG